MKKASDKCKALVKKWEKCVLSAYMAPEQVKLFKETGRKEYTIGFGATYIPANITIGINGKQVKFSKPTSISGDMILDSVDEAAKLLDLMLPIYEKPVNELVKVPLNQDQYDALVSFCFNAGGANFGSSTALKELNKGNYAGASANLARWDNIGKEESLGLENRRVDEITLFNSVMNSIKY